jgi:hypothetical protein
MTSTALKLRYRIVKKREKQALIHIAKKALGLDDDDYYALIMGEAGIESTKDLEYEDQFNGIMKAFKKLGFKQETGISTSRPKWTERWGCTDAQRAKIEAMWRTCARTPTDRALRAFIKRITHVDHPAFLRPALAGKVINALNTMMVKAGYDPETGRRLVP